MFGRKRPAFRTRITEDEFSGFRLTIPMKRHWLRIAVLATMLFGWAVLELVCMALLVNGPSCTSRADPRSPSRPNPEPASCSF